MEIIDQKIGAVGAVDLKVEAGKLLLDLKVGWDPAGVGSQLTVSMDATVVLDALAKAIPGSVDDAIIAVMKAALKAL